MKRQLTLYVDTHRCMGCRACETACKLENGLPAGPRYTMVTETEVTEEGCERLMFLPVPCHHCADAPCAKACPTGAVSKREDGVVTVDSRKCIGCHECLWACPYGVPQFGDSGKMSKCTLCIRQVEEGLKPACVRACPAEAPMFGTAEEIRAVLKARYGEEEFARLAEIPERAGE